MSEISNFIFLGYLKLFYFIHLQYLKKIIFNFFLITLSKQGGFYTTLDGGFDAMLCWGPNYECNLYWGNTWPLEVVAWWFLQSSGVFKIVTRTDGFQKISLLSVIRRVWWSREKYGLWFVLGNSTWCYGLWP